MFHLHKLLWSCVFHLHRLLWLDSLLLQEYCQQSGKPIPEYHLVGEGGPDHLKTFVVEVAIEGVPYGKGEGDTKKKAETLAAEEALTKLDLE